MRRCSSCSPAAATAAAGQALRISKGQAHALRKLEPAPLPSEGQIVIVTFDQIT